ncbi:MAG: cellulase family glycosylhydrolase [Planctomycetota bacterium]|nr:cellulase family glycosylhydrolase [Planctomycetota bacterium]
MRPADVFCKHKRWVIPFLLALAVWTILLPTSANSQPTRALEPIVVDAAGRGFVQSVSQRPFRPWGFNYDHDAEGRLLEDYWHTEWPLVESHFRKMRLLGANVVRIHLQFGRFCPEPGMVAKKELDQLEKLVALAEREGLYLDLTGLGCYHKADVPAWYDALNEADRWKAQAAFWSAVAGRVAKSGAIFCYDLMNEPVVSGGKRPAGDWLGPPFAGKHFVQFVALDPQSRPRPDVAREWIETLVRAIRKVDDRHLITVGMVDWSLDRPGLTSGFVPAKVSEKLDFLSVHLYPEKGKLAEAQETLRLFADVGKPVVIEETFPLKSGFEEFELFLDQSTEKSAGVIGFFWGESPADLRPPKSIGQAITLQWLELFERRAKK